MLKLSKTWACVAGCGACCYLQPEERPYLMDYFEDPEDLALYNSMVGDDGWCVFARALDVVGLWWMCGGWTARMVVVVCRRRAT